LEFQEVSLFRELGHDVFSPGAYVSTENRGDGCMRPDIPGLQYDPETVAMFHALGKPGEDNKSLLTKEFVDRFDVVIVMHLPHWIVQNWEAMKHKTVIWRTIGQSIPQIEQTLKPYRDQGLKIIRYSPRERVLDQYAGEDALIRFYKDPDEYGGWTGEKVQIINFTQSMPNRGEHCSYQLFKDVTQGFPTKLYGPGNEAAGDIDGGKQPFAELKQLLRTNRAYLYTGTHPASYTLAFIEAWMSGIPVVSVGYYWGNPDWYFRPPNPGDPSEHGLFEVPDLITHGVDGFVSDHVGKLRGYVQSLLDDPVLAKIIGDAGRKKAIELFGKTTIMEQWRVFLDGLEIAQ